ncbi:hypothetical protein ACNOYE_30425 [Nannocystaceae bacterium ST9]
MKMNLRFPHIFLFLTLPTGCVIEVAPAEDASDDDVGTSVTDAPDTDGTDASGADTSGADTSGSDTSGADTSGTDTSDGAPSDPCAGLPDGDYCGSDDQLRGYEGDPEALVTCSQGALVDTTVCEFGCDEVAGECFVPGPECGNGMIDPGEECEGNDPGDATCQSEGHDGGDLACSACHLDDSQCCDDECSPGASMCTNNEDLLCVESSDGCGVWEVQGQCEFCGDGNIDPGEECDSGNFGGQTCQSMNFDDGELNCTANCSIDDSQCCNQDHTILNAVFPTYTSNASGCALDNGVALKASAQQISDSTIRFHIKKTDNSAWGAAAVLSLYVGVGPTCGNPPNVVKKTANVVVGQTIQTIDLVVDPYDAAWAMDETKQFWVGKSESGFAATRSTGTISIKRECKP